MRQNKQLLLPLSVHIICSNNVLYSFPDLSKLYKLLRNIPRGLQAMVAELEEHITKSGRNLVIVVHTAHVYFKIKDLFFKKIVTQLERAICQKIQCSTLA